MTNGYSAASGSERVWSCYARLLSRRYPPATARGTVLAVVCAALVGCGASGADKGPAPSAAEVRRQSSQANTAPAASARYGKPVRLATLEGVGESSGLAASRRNPGLFWTHNDSGGGPLLYAFDRTGRARGVWRVAGARNVDWEDMAAGPGPGGSGPYLYVGDIGDNQGRRAELVVYRFEEPTVAETDAPASAREPRETAPAEAIRLRYPDGERHDAEALLVHPATGDLYVVTKKAVGPAGVYKLAAPFDAARVNTLSRVGEALLPGLFGGFVTGGDISPDGRRVVLCDYLNAYELSLEGGGADSFDRVWAAAPLPVDLGERRQGEAVCYGADGEAVYATSEKRPVPLIEVKRKN